MKIKGIDLLRRSNLIQNLFKHWIPDLTSANPNFFFIENSQCVYDVT